MDCPSLLRRKVENYLIFMSNHPDHKQGKSSAPSYFFGSSSSQSEGQGPSRASSSSLYTSWDQIDDDQRRQSRSQGSKRFNRVTVQDLLNADPDQERPSTQGDSRRSEGIPNIRCEINHCGRRFASKDSLVAHQKRQHAPPTSFVCQFCRSSYSSLPNLNKHVRSVHEKQKPFKCEKCTSSFAFKDGLQRHLQMVHEDLRPFPCTYCSLKFKTKSHLHKHLLAIHPKNKSGSGKSGHGPTRK